MLLRVNLLGTRSTIVNRSLVNCTRTMDLSGGKITIFLKKLIVFFYTAAAAKSIQNSQTCCFLFNSYPVDTTGTTQFNGVMGMSKRTSKSPSNSRPQSPARAQKRKLDEREPGEIIRSPRESTDVYPSKRQTREDAENISGIWHIPPLYQNLPKKRMTPLFKDVFC